MTELVLFTIYQNPRDYPGRFVVRRWRAIAGNDSPVADFAPLAICKTLEAARAALPAGLSRLPAEAGDDPCIVETWI